MMKQKKYRSLALVLLLASFCLSSCSDEWDAHYKVEDTGKIDSNLYDYIKSRSDLSLFLSMINHSGYDTILNQKNAYTVWAPTNASLAQSPFLLDTASWKNLVSNHIATYAHPISQADSMTLTMLNGKRLVFNTSGTTTTLDGILQIENDKATKNGLLQVINNVIPYRLNQWETIQQLEGIDSLRNYVNSLTKREFNKSLSYENGAFVDSVFTTKNDVLDNLGSFTMEDSIYTSILPDNNAWIEAYNRISPYFKMKPSDGGDVAQRANTLWTMVKDLFFWGKIETPIAGGNVYSTSYSKFTNADSLFLDAEKMTLSNGYGYKTSKLTHKPIESWCKEIRVEAENAFSGRYYEESTYDLYTMSSLGTDFNVSKGGYLYCKSKSNTSALSTLAVYFPIPNTLSTKYNIYVVFVPTTIVDPTDKRPYKVEFSITNNIYNITNSAAPKPTYTKLVVSNNVTDSVGMTKMLVAKNYEFTTANLTGTNWKSRSVAPPTMTSAVTFGLKIRNIAGVSAADQKNFNRSMRIDCIILEPVQ